MLCSDGAERRDARCRSNMCMTANRKLGGTDLVERESAPLMSLDLASTDMSSPVGATGQSAISAVELLHLSELARSDAPFDRIQQQMIGAARRWVAAESVSLFVADAGGKPDEVHSNV